MKRRRILFSSIVLGTAFAAAVTAGPQTASQNTHKPPNSRDEQQTLISSVAGVDLYRSYCAPCHGKSAKGDGPVAPALRVKVPDLTVLARNNGGQFPEMRVRSILSGSERVVSHGSRDMPVWGPLFHQPRAPVDLGPVRLNNLVKYLESVQANAKT